MEYIWKIEWYKIYKTDKPRYRRIVKNWMEIFVDVKKYAETLECSNYETRLDNMKAIINILPEELPYEVREYIVFNY